MEKTLSRLDKLILFAVFITPLKDIIIVHIGIIDFRITHLVWFAVFGILLIKRTDIRYRDSCTCTDDKNNKLIFVLYIGMLLITVLYSIDMERSIKELVQYLYLFAAMYIIYVKSKDMDFLRKIIKVSIISNAVIDLIVFLCLMAGKALIPQIHITQTGAVYLNDTFLSTQSLIETGSSIDRINILGMGPIGLTFYVLLQSLLINYSIRKAKGGAKIFLAALFISDACIAVIGYSRIGILLFFILNIATMFTKNKMRNIGIGLLTALGACIFILLDPNVLYRVLETFNTEELSSKYHFVFWLIALKTGYNNILTGIGPGNMESHPGNNDYLFQQFGIFRTDTVPTHNFVLQIWSEQGVIGLLLNLTMLALPVIYYVNARFVRRSVPAGSIYKYIILGFTGICIYSLTNNSYYIETFWEFIGITYAVKYHLTREGNLFDLKYANPRHVNIFKNTIASN